MVTVADIVRGEGKPFLETQFVTPVQRKAMRDIVCCRTEAMGTVPQRCERCRGEYPLFRSCGNRSCPACGGTAREKWLEARRGEILPVEYLHVVFKTPPELRVLAQYCPEVLYKVVIRAAGQAVMEVGREKFHLQLGCLAQLQTWTQLMAYYLHVHCVVPCGGFSEDGSRWVSFRADKVPRKALWRCFRGLVCEGIRAAAEEGKLGWLPSTISVEQILARVRSRRWKVYAKRPYGGVETLLEYLSRYICRVAITNERIESYEDHQVTIRYYQGNEEKRCRLGGQEFQRRLLMHVPPKGFVRIRSYGFLGNRARKTRIEDTRRLIGEAPPRAPSPERVRPLRLCPACYAEMYNGRRHPFAPAPEVASQLGFKLRPPPIYPVAA